ncbi:hypothetical protein K469DRAFT_347739 [Zopfia rhizophila CBS 207.26]|uniref:Rhodopsin domain-containing protein n=1 Tax=Zopfia rhizophila CBS 207.26 TaxID=1314779 RepID=A0A6A6DEU1_9PEZI|nr:hypothetical protein K469DRAFT_347739 [Zopfia rhizophila CBS 207.26]
MADASSTFTATPTGRPSGISEPLAAIGDKDQSGLIAILAAFALGLVLLSITVRIYARHNFISYRVDDFTFFAASAFAIIQASLVFRELSSGLGKLGSSLPSEQTASIQKISFVADLFYLFPLFLSKASTSFLFIYLTPGRSHHRIIWTTIAASVTWLISSVILEGIRCHSSHPWTDDISTCPNFFARWAFIAIFDTLIEIGLVATAIYIVWDLQMELMSKVIVVGAFSCRIPNAAFSITRLAFLHHSLTPTTSHYYTSRIVCTTQLSIGYTITASIIPYLKPFMQAYEQPPSSYPSKFSKSSKSSKSSNFKLSSLTGKTAVSSNTDGVDDEPREPVNRLVRKEIAFMRGGGVGRLRPEDMKYEAKASAMPTPEAVEHDGEGGGADDDSQVMIIKKGVEWSVQHERAGSASGTTGTTGTDGIEIIGRESV